MKNWIRDFIWKTEPMSKRFNNGFWTGRMDACTDLKDYVYELEQRSTNHQERELLHKIWFYAKDKQVEAWSKLDES